MQEWFIDGPKVLDIGDEGERVRALKAAVVAGQIDVVTHDDSPTARLEVSSITGEPLTVRWNGTELKVMHGKDFPGAAKEFFSRFASRSDEERECFISLSLPVDCDVKIHAVRAEVLVNGTHGRAKINTVSGDATLSDIEGDLKVNTVSGALSCLHITGALDANTVSGDVTVQDSSLPTITLNVVSGDFNLDLLQCPSQISTNSVSGDITVRVPRLSGYDATLNTLSGKAVIDGQRLTRNTGKGGGRIRYGDESLRLNANSVSGNITVLVGEPA